MNAADSTAHLGEDAELYALGSLDELARSRADAHLAICDDCTQRVGEAESAVALLIEPHDARPALDARIAATFAPRARNRVRADWWLAVAAALLIGLLPATYFFARDRSAHAEIAMQSVALDSLVHSHFLHAPLVFLTPGAPPAKVIYPRKGVWLFVLVGGSHDYNVVAQPGDRVLGAVQPFGTTSTLYVASAPNVKALLLREGATVIGHAAIAR